MDMKDLQQTPFGGLGYCGIFSSAGMSTGWSNRACPSFYAHCYCFVPLSFLRIENVRQCHSYLSYRSCTPKNIQTGVDVPQKEVCTVLTHTPFENCIRNESFSGFRYMASVKDEALSDSKAAKLLVASSEGRVLWRFREFGWHCETENRQMIFLDLFREFSWTCIK